MGALKTREMTTTERHTAFLKPDDSSSDSSEDGHEAAPLHDTATATGSDSSTADDCYEVSLWHRAKESRWCRVATHVSVKPV